MTIWAVIPVKPLRDSKSRLAHILTPDQRAELTSQLLQRTLHAIKESEQIYRTLVISRDPAVLKLARQEGVFTFNEGDRQGLNPAVTRAAGVTAARRADSILILPADLPFITAEDIVKFTLPLPADTEQTHDLAIICPDLEYEGTNALLLSPPLEFTFQYGVGSFHKHKQETLKRQRRLIIVELPGIQFDVDTEEDWTAYQVIERRPLPPIPVPHYG